MADSPIISNQLKNDRFDIEGIKRAHDRYASGEGKAPEKYFGEKGMTRHLALSERGKERQGKEMHRQLSRLQKNAPTLAANLAKGKKSALTAFAGGLLGKIDWSKDWLFFLLLTFAALKDLFDIAFAGAAAGVTGLVGWVPIAGQAATATMAAIGMTMTFVGDMMFLMLTVTVLVLAGEKIMNRGFAKYILGIAMEFIAEALPGISLLPWTVLYVVILYVCVLYDRKMNAIEAQQSSQPESSASDVPAYAAADDH
jgi:hypothetical protein